AALLVVHVDQEIADRGVLDLEIAVLVGQGEVRVVEHRDATAHPAVDVAGQLQRSLLRLQRLLNVAPWWDRQIDRAVDVRAADDSRVVRDWGGVLDLERLPGPQHRDARLKQALRLVDDDLLLRDRGALRIDWQRAALLSNEPDHNVFHALTLRVDDEFVLLERALGEAMVLVLIDVDLRGLGNLVLDPDDLALDVAPLLGGGGDGDSKSDH